MNKLTKLLSVFAIAGAIGTGVAGAAGCAHKHTYSEDWTADGANGHYHLATCEHKEEHDELVPHGTANSEGKCPDCGYQLTTAPSEKLVVAADVTGLMIEGVTAETITLSETKKSHTIDKSAIKVYFAKGANADQKGDEVPAAYVVLELKDGAGAAVSSWENITKDDAYKVNASLKNAEMASGATSTIDDLKATVTVTVSNPVVAGSLVVKTGATLEQVAGVDSISSTWTYEVTRANGDKEDVAASDVTIGSEFSTMVAGDSKTTTISCTINGVAITGTVNYKITPNNDRVTQSFALNFSALTPAQEDAIKAQAEDSHNPLVLQDGRFAVCSTKTGSIDSHGKSFEGKYFAKRLKMAGASNAGKCPRYIKVHADGPAMLTVYAYCNTGTAGTTSDRKVGVYGAMAVTTSSPFTAKFTEPVGESQATTEKTDTKHVFTIPEAGDYYIISEVNGICFTYVQLDQQVSAVGNEAISLGGKVVASNVTVTHTSGKSAHVALGTTFDSIKSEYTVKILGVNNVTCDSGETDVTGDAKLTFEVPGDFATTIGEKIITVKYDNDASTTIKVYVESGVSGIYGMTSVLDSSVSTQIPAGTKLTVKKSDIVNTLLGASDNASAEITSYTVTYNDNIIDGVNGMEFEISATPYVITVTAEVADGNSTDTITATFELTVSQQVAAGDLSNVVSTGEDTTKIIGTLTSSSTDLVNTTSGRIFITANSENTVAVEANSKTIDGIAFTDRIKLGGAGTINYRSVGFEVKAGATIVIYAVSSSGGADRDTFLLDANGNKVQGTDTKVAGSAPAKYTFTVTTAGTYYFAAQTGGTNVYGASIIYNA